MLLGNRLLLRAGLRRRADGWRRGAGLVLRGQGATFVLSAFGLDLWSDVAEPSSPTIDASREHFAQRFASFLADDKDCHICVIREAAEDRVHRCAGPTYTLRFDAWIPSAGRFVPPDDWHGDDCSNGRNAGDPLFTVVCRIDHAGVADVWMRINHIGMDGVLAQEILSRLESAWGVAGEVVYPTPESFITHSSPRRCFGCDDILELNAFLDFGPLLAWRKSENARLPEPMTLSAAVIWCLARHPTFCGLHVGTTVDVPAAEGLGRGVGMISIRAANYLQRRDGLAQFVKKFNHELALTRKRASGGCRSLDAAALIPPRLATRVLRHALQTPRVFGSIGLTVLRDAKVFGAPLADAGHPHGFIAIGSVNLPAADGRRVACVCIKGRDARICTYPQSIQEAIDQL